MKKKLVDYELVGDDNEYVAIPVADAERRDKVDTAKDAVVTAAGELTGEYIVAHGLMGKLADALAALDEVRDE